jgi:hypothetical protein
MIGKALLDSVVAPRNKKPTDVEQAQHLFFEQGIGLDKFNSYPIPYILSMIYTTNYNAKQAEAERKKSQKKK